SAPSCSAPRGSSPTGIWASPRSGRAPRPATRPASARSARRATRPCPAARCTTCQTAGSSRPPGSPTPIRTRSALRGPNRRLRAAQCLGDLAVPVQLGLELVLGVPHDEPLHGAEPALLLLGVAVADQAVQQRGGALHAQLDLLGELAVRQG